MFKAVIRPQWQLVDSAGRELPARLLPLLVGIHDLGTLAAACRRVDMSYRYAWGLLQQAEAILGQPLLRSTRGRGAALTALGETLVWADRRVQARLSPTLDMLASEIEVEVERQRHAGERILRIHATHGFAVEVLNRSLVASDTPVELQYRGSDEVLASLRSGRCDLAGLHLPIGELEGKVLAHYIDRLDPVRDRILHLTTRRQGLALAPGNPKQVFGLRDLTRADLRFINRQPGSGTRLVFDTLLAHEGIAPSDIHGYDTTEFTHAAVAAFVASGMADVGFGLEAPAQRFGLAFAPIVTENYFFVFNADLLQSPMLATVRAIQRSEAFRAEVNRISGYDAGRSGEVSTLGNAFASARGLLRGR